jgi:hypothetical protein
MDRRTATRLSKFLSLVLRHRPDDYGLAMDGQGFVDFESLIDVLVAETSWRDGRAGRPGTRGGSERRRFRSTAGDSRCTAAPRAFPPVSPDDPWSPGTAPRPSTRHRSGRAVTAGRAFVHLSSNETKRVRSGPAFRESHSGADRHERGASARHRVSPCDRADLAVPVAAEGSVHRARRRSRRAAPAVASPPQQQPPRSKPPGA